MDHELFIRAPLEHACYAGHFPGNPIVPGVVLLDLIVMALERGAPCAVGDVKFHRAVRPGDRLTLGYRVAGPQLSFRCMDGEQLVAAGRLTFAT
jgi:3-hydroxyacyl-[acyl-carrier-protein] dehydratase